MDPWHIHVIINAAGENVWGGDYKDSVFETYQSCMDFMKSSSETWVDAVHRLTAAAVSHFGPEITIAYDCIQSGASI